MKTEFLICQEAARKVHCRVTREKLPLDCVARQPWGRKGCFCFFPCTSGETSPRKSVFHTVLGQLFSLVPASKHCRDIMWTWRFTIFLIGLVGLSGIWQVSATNCKGCTPLDVLSFDKIVDKFQASLVKFDVPFPYGDKQDVFAKVRRVFEHQEISRLLFESVCE